MKVIETKNAPGAIGPYSQAFEVFGLIITSGQKKLNQLGELVADRNAVRLAPLDEGHEIVMLQFAGE